MWLLSTDRAELHYFARHFDAEGGYAILSHTWDKEHGEQSLQELRAIGERCQANGTNPRDFVDEKIRECCILAEKHGYRWVWIDSCCIDKTSSSELSEAINSMYRWYKSSEVCYAYLKDVPTGSKDMLEAPESPFRKSRWHTRGWTLQELIAPDAVIFLSSTWEELGNRVDLAGLVENITGVPSGILTGEDRPAEWGVSNRMSWASRRQTTRIEDEAYCLMGLFGISMPTNYGEGKRAFIRLQYEIMQHQECDMSLFAFGEVLEQDEIIRDGIVMKGFDEHIDRGAHWQYLLADSPRQFRNSFGYIPSLGPNALQRYPDPRRSRSAGPFDRVELPHATATSHGVQFRLPVATVGGVIIAVILCQAGKRHFGLFLTRDDRAKDPQRPRYFVGRGYTRAATGSASYLARMCDLGGDLHKLTFNGKRVKASWSTIYIVPTATDLDSESANSPSLLMNCHPGSLFQLPRSLVDRFIGLQFEVDEVLPAYIDTLKIVSFVHRSQGRIYVGLGTCKEHHGPDKPPLWAKAFVTTLVSPRGFTHDCSQDHLDSEAWALRSRTFGDADRTVRLSFSPSRRRLPEISAIIHLELSGHRFEEMLREASISFPSLVDHKRNSGCPMPDTLVTSSFQRPLPPQLAKLLKSVSNEASRQALDAHINTLLQESLAKLEKDSPLPIPNMSVTLSIPRSSFQSPLAEIEAVVHHQSSPSRWASSTTALHAPFARFLRLLPRKGGLHATPANDSSSPIPSTDAP